MQNILETQVSDLTNLADSPIAIPISYEMNSEQRQASNTESPVCDYNGKRKIEDGQNGTSHTRAKRNRYISIACNECKRRKIKCNGNTPCQRCGNLNLDCQYAPNCCSNGFKDSEEFKQINMQLSALQEQVDNLYSSLTALRAGDPLAFGQRLSPERSISLSQHSVNTDSPSVRLRPPYRQPRFQGPTSSAFSLDLAKNTLHNMGYPGLAEGGDGVNTRDDTPLGSPPLPSQPMLSGSFRGPLWSINKDEAVRLCRVYHEEMGLMYPVLNIECVIQYASSLYRFLEAATRTGLINEQISRNEIITNANSNILKMVLANALTVEGSGQSELGNRLFESVRGHTDSLLQQTDVDVKNLPLLALVAMYHFHCDEEALAWRMIGQVARMCIELGLHRRDSLFKAIPDNEERASAIRLFWSIYVLDRRWSFGTGMPFAMQDADIDPALPEPEVEIPYLNVMIAYSRLGSRVWRSVAGFESVSTADIRKEDIGYLDYQINQWQKSIPPELHLPTTNTPQSASRAIQRLQILLYLRFNQMRITIYRPVLHSANSIMENLSYAQTVVDLAKDTIRALTHLNQTTDIYRVQQVCFNYFLISALAVIFLASCHAPVQFSAVCRDEFYMALDLVKGFSSKSYISKRLWKAIRGLKEIGPKLGLSEDVGNSEVEDPHSSAALAMAGLAGHEITGIGSFMGSQQDRSDNTMGNSPMNGFQMSHEMTSLFEAVLGSASATNGSAQSYVGAGMLDSVQNDGLGVGLGGAQVFGGDEGLYRQMRDLF